MKNLRVAIGDGAIVSWINKEGYRVAIPLLNINGKWRGCGVRLVYGHSASDPAFATVFALPHNWEPSSRIIRAIRRA